jgi:hypothetical protein
VSAKPKPIPASEAAQLPDIVGKWVAVQVRDVDLNSVYPILYEGDGIPEDTSVIFLPDGGDNDGRG